MQQKTVCDKEKCCGCGACISTCSAGAISLQDNLKTTQAVINPDKCVNCRRCFAVCPQLSSVTPASQISWYQGWAEKSVREQSSSGGFAFKISEGFINAGGVVCSCAFEKSKFSFLLADTVEALHKLQGSKYVKSNPQDCYVPMHQALKQGKKVLFIGLPCQVAAVKNYMGEALGERLYTIDLICHGTPSVKVLEAFLKEQGEALSETTHIAFRSHTSFGIQTDHFQEPHGLTDWYMIAFLEGLCYTENCYECAYARLERVADVTLGDSWGSELTDEVAKGISLALCQTKKGEELLSHIQSLLQPVNLQKAAAANHQLNAPSKKPVCYDAFMQGLQEGILLSRLIKKHKKVICMKRLVKIVLKKLHLWA